MSNQTKQEELQARLDTFLNNSDWGVTLFAGHRDVLVKNIGKFINREVTSVLDELKEPTLNDVILMEPDQYEGGRVINEYWKKSIQSIRERYDA